MRSQVLNQPLDLAGVKVLVVDDDLDTLELLTFVLEIYGATVTKAASSVEALALFDAMLPDVLVSDISMPEIDGYNLLQQVKAKQPLDSPEQPLAIALTAHTRELSQQQAIAVGFQHYVCKPVDPDELVQEIARLMTAG